MDKKEIMSVWAAFQEVQEKKKAKLDPVGKEDGDVDNDGDEDSSDEYLANRRKKVGAAMKKEGTLPPALQKAIDKKKGKKVDDDDSDEKSDDGDSDEKSKKPEKGVNPFAKKKDVKESEESPYPTLNKKKREKKGSNLEDAGGPAAKLKGEAVEKGEVECPKCKGKGCDHCDDKGTHVKEGYQDFIESLDNEELEAYVDWLMEEVTPADHLSGKLMKHKKKLQPAAYKKHHSNLMSKDPKKIQNSLDRLKAMESVQLDAFDIIESVLERRQLAKPKREGINFDLFSEAELDALAEKMKQPGDTGGKGEEFMSTSSPKEKKVMADHEAGSEKKYEDWEDTSEKDGSKAGRAVKSQSPVRRGESRKSETMGKVKGS
jgi:hypothetical protein